MFIIDDTKKAMLNNLVEEGKNILLTGPTGCGKTSLAIEIAKEQNLNPVVINCGSTQDARSSLIGYFTLKDGNTEFEEADFLKAVQEPNTLVILDEISRASDDAYNIIFPLLDFRRDIRVDERSENRVVEVADNVKFISTANIGIEYSATRSIDRALQDRFLVFNIPYLKGSAVKKLISSEHGVEVSREASPLLKIYDYSHKMFLESKLTAMLSTRLILDVVPLVKKFKVSEILDNVVFSIFRQDSSSIISDENILREFADSLGVYNNE